MIYMQSIDVSNIFFNFAFNAIKTKMKKDINRIKVVLVEKKRTNKWLAEQLGKTLQPFPNGVRILPNPTW